MYPPAFEYAAPTSFEEALAILANEGEPATSTCPCCRDRVWSAIRDAQSG